MTKWNIYEPWCCRFLTAIPKEILRTLVWNILQSNHYINCVKNNNKHLQQVQHKLNYTVTVLLFL